MQIHELNSFSGNPGATDYMVIDDGTETTKLPGNTWMREAEADAKYQTPAQADAKYATITDSILKVSKSSVSSLSTTITNAKITSSMEVVHSVLSNPAAQTGDWTVTTSNGSLSIAGTISGTTDITLYLAVPRT